jgi:hypothetical protein
MPSDILRDGELAVEDLWVVCAHPDRGSVRDRESGRGSAFLRICNRCALVLYDEIQINIDH